jgi:hypothetical protein
VATDQEVAAKRASVENLREQVRQARVAQSTQAREGENDISLASLSSEEERLKAELSRLTGGAEAPAPAPAPEPEPAPKPASAKGGSDNSQEG